MTSTNSKSVAASILARLDNLAATASEAWRAASVAGCPALGSWGSPCGDPQCPCARAAAASEARYRLATRAEALASVAVLCTVCRFSGQARWDYSTAAAQLAPSWETARLIERELTARGFRFARLNGARVS